jgi:hypothetical protein
MVSAEGLEPSTHALKEFLRKNPTTYTQYCHLRRTKELRPLETFAALGEQGSELGNSAPRSSAVFTPVTCAAGFMGKRDE